MGMIPESTVEQVRNANDIVEVIGGYVPLKRRGREFMACCPFHQEKTPSFTVSPQKQMYYCFGCHKGGDVFKFLCEIENLEYPEAIRRLAERVGIEIEETRDDGMRRSVKDALYHALEVFAQYWHDQLLRSREGLVARKYLEERGVSQESILDFRLGYSPLAWEDSPRQAGVFGVELQHLVDTGLAVAKEASAEGGAHRNDVFSLTTKNCYGRFRGRLMFPICDDQGRVVGFSGRVLYPEQDKMGKYVNSPETPLFHKGNLIFGLHKAKREIMRKGFSVVCEGQLDLIRCHAAGFRNVVAPQGTAFTLAQARLLKRYAPEVVVCFDGDNAGQNAAVKALDVTAEAGLSMRVALLPKEHDPDTYIRTYGAEAFGNFLGQARQFFDFYLAYLANRHSVDSDTGRIAIVQRMGEALLKVNQPLLRDTYSQKTAQLLRVSPRTVLDEFLRCKPRVPSVGGYENLSSVPRYEGNVPSSADNVAVDEDYEDPSEREKWLLVLLLINEEQWDVISGVFQPEWIDHLLVRKIVTTALDMYCAGLYSTHALMDAFPGGMGRDLLLTALVQTERKIPEPCMQLKALLTALRGRYCDRLLRGLQNRMSEPGVSNDVLMDLLRQQNRIRELKKVDLFGEDKTEDAPSESASEIIAEDVPTDVREDPLEDIPKAQEN